MRMQVGDRCLCCGRSDAYLSKSFTCILPPIPVIDALVFGEGRNLSSVGTGGRGGGGLENFPQLLPPPNPCLVSLLSVDFELSVA